MPIENIRFANQPKLSEDEADKNFNERRGALLPFVEKYISESDFFQGEEVNITFSHTGVSSLVCIIETAKGKTVLKIALSKDYSKGEAQFLKVWEEAGVKVPHVLDSGEIDGSPYTLMEYVEAPMISEAYTDAEMAEKGVYAELGATLHLMHEPAGEGYGRVVDGKGEYESLAEWLASPDIQTRLEYARENNLLPELQELMPKVFEILIAHDKKEKRSSYCHDDFAGNIFATEPITVFDPNPRFNNRYIDVGRTMMNFLAVGRYPKQLVESYFANEVCDERVLLVAVFLGIFMKLTYSHKKGKTERLKNWGDYVSKNKHLL